MIGFQSKPEGYSYMMSDAFIKELVDLMRKHRMNVEQFGVMPDQDRVNFFALTVKFWRSLAVEPESSAPKLKFIK